MITGGHVRGSQHLVGREHTTVFFSDMIYESELHYPVNVLLTKQVALTAMFIILPKMICDLHWQSL